MSTKRVIRNTALVAALGLAPLSHAQLLGAGSAGGGLVGGAGASGIDGALMGRGAVHGRLNPRDITHEVRNTRQATQHDIARAAGEGRHAARRAIGTAGALEPALPAPTATAGGGASGAAGASIAPDEVMLDAAGGAHGNTGATTGLRAVDDSVQPVGVSAENPGFSADSPQP